MGGGGRKTEGKGEGKENILHFGNRLRICITGVRYVAGHVTDQSLFLWTVKICLLGNGNLRPRFSHDPF